MSVLVLEVELRRKGRVRPIPLELNWLSGETADEEKLLNPQWTCGIHLAHLAADLQHIRQPFDTRHDTRQLRDIG